MKKHEESSNIVHSNAFSVLLPVYRGDDAKLLRMAIDSIFSNSICPAMLLIVIDGPIGVDLAQVISEFALRADVKIVKNEINMGLARNLNRGLSELTTEFVFRADADDYNFPSRFERQLSLLLKGYHLIGSGITEVDDSGNAYGDRIPPLSLDEIKKFVKRRNPFNHMTVAFRRTAVIDAGGYPDVYLKEDYALWATMISRGCRCVNTPDILVRATAGPAMYKRRGGLRYVRSEFQMQKHLYSLGFNNFTEAVLIGFSRSLVFVLPSWFRGLIYKNMLRS